MIIKFKFCLKYLSIDDLSQNLQYVKNSLTSKIKQVEDKVKRKLDKVTKFISDEEDERAEELKEIIQSREVLKTKIIELNGEIKKFNKDLIMEEEKVNEYSDLSLSLQKALIQKVELKSIAKQLKGILITF